VCGSREGEKGSIGMLKLKPVMLELLGIKKDTTYYVCNCSYESEAVSLGKRRRWTEDAKLNIGISDIVDESVKANIERDHAYGRDSDEEDSSKDAVDLKMGTDQFFDSGSLTFKEETIEEEEVKPANDSEEIVQPAEESQDSFHPFSSQESGSAPASQSSEAASSQGRAGLPEYLLVNTRRLLNLLRRQCLFPGCRALVEEPTISYQVRQLR
jgi:hypothetical protein